MLAYIGDYVCFGRDDAGQLRLRLSHTKNEILNITLEREWSNFRINPEGEWDMLFTKDYTLPVNKETILKEVYPLVRSTILTPKEITGNESPGVLKWKILEARQFTDNSIRERIIALLTTLDNQAKENFQYPLLTSSEK